MHAEAVIVPELGAPARIARLPVREGQAVQSCEILAVLESASQEVAISAPVSGVVTGLHAVVGQPAVGGAVVCYLAPLATLPAAAHEKPALLIYGAGGHGKAVIDLVRALGFYHPAGWIDDGLAPGSLVMGVPVLGDAKALTQCYRSGIRLAANAVGGIGNAAVRERIFEQLGDVGFDFPALVHPRAAVEASATLQAGVQVLPQAYVGSEAVIGFGAVLNAGAIVSHDCVLGRVTNLSPGAALAGHVVVEDLAQIGMNATVNLHVRIGAGCIIGNGATVKADVPAGTRVWAGSTWPLRNS